MCIFCILIEVGCEESSCNGYNVLTDPVVTDGQLINKKYFQ